MALPESEIKRSKKGRVTLPESEIKRSRKGRVTLGYIIFGKVYLTPQGVRAP